MTSDPRKSSTSPAQYESLATLYRAALDLYSDLSQEGVLRRVIQTAQELVNARYAGVRLPATDARDETYVSPGISDEYLLTMREAFRREAWVDEMVQSEISIRLDQLSEDLDRVMFPFGGHKQRALLTSPIKMHDRTLGHIILIEKQGGGPFSAQDQERVEALATYAAAALENAALYGRMIESEQALTHRNLELELINSLATMVGTKADLENMSLSMLDRIQHLYKSSIGEVFRSIGSEGEYRLIVRVGEDEDRYWKTERFRVGKGFLGRVVNQGEIMVFTDLASRDEQELRRLSEKGFHELVCIPLKAPGKIAGLMNFAVRNGDAQMMDLSMLRALSAGMGIAIENSRLYQQARHIAVLEERERIGMDLHDGVIQSIYAVGLMLDYTKLLIKRDPEGAMERLQQSIDALNVTIRDIRSYILDLQPIRIPSTDLLPALKRLVREFKANTLIEAEMEVDEEAIKHLKPSVVNNFFLIAQEALANVAKHAHASHVSLQIHDVDGEVEMRVVDNGRGFEISPDTGVLGHGLSNMLSRAQSAGGELVVNSSRGEGTTLSARFPPS